MAEVNGLQVRGVLESLGDGRFEGQIAARITWPRPAGGGEASLECAFSEFDQDTGEQTRQGLKYRSGEWSGLEGSRVVARVKLNTRAGYKQNAGRIFTNWELVTLEPEDGSHGEAKVAAGLLKRPLAGVGNGNTPVA